MNCLALLQERCGLNRRSFSKLSLGAIGGLWMTAKGLGQEQGSGPDLSTLFQSYGELPANAGQVDHTIQYIRASAPEFHIPSYRGERYEDTVPNTLDISERAKLGVHILTAITDSRAGDEIYWSADFSRNPPVMTHDFNDWMQKCEGFMQSLPLLRMATGSNLNNQVDPVWMTGILRSIGPDGLAYLPLKECPRARINIALPYLSLV